MATDGDDMGDFLLPKKGLERWTWTSRILAKFRCAANFATAVNMIISLAVNVTYTNTQYSIFIASVLTT